MSLESILIFGCGNMGGAMLAGWLAGGVAPERFTIVDPYLPSAPQGVELHREVPQRRVGSVLLGVKPQMLDEIVPVLAPALDSGAVLLSLLAGVELASLASRFPAAGAIVRVMPNLAAAIGKAPIGLAERGLDVGGRTAIEALMAPLGLAEWIDEAQFDLVTALAGSGPAFVYRFIDALAAGSAALGLPADQAERLAVTMVEGAAALAAGSPHSPGELARRVASPGGTTQAGLDVLDADAALARLVQATLAAARDRGAEIARAAR